MPWYNSNDAHQGEGDNMMASMEPLLNAAGVDIVLAGHVHAYERSVCPNWFNFLFGPLFLSDLEPNLIIWFLVRSNVFTMADRILVVLYI